jgi:hypothetical protein
LAKKGVDTPSFKGVMDKIYPLGKQHLLESSATNLSPAFVLQNYGNMDNRKPEARGMMDSTQEFMR